MSFRVGPWLAVLLVAACTMTAVPSSTSTPRTSGTPRANPSTDNPMPSIPAQPTPFPLGATIPELQDAMDAGELTSVELVDFYLARIAAYDDAGPQLNALILVNPTARDEAAALDAERASSGPRGLLHGIPVVLKDNINTADMPTTAGSLALEGFRPADDAFQVTRLRQAGAVIIGKTNLFEFAHGWETVSSLGGQTLNPYDTRRDPGGSSGGTAVAVATNFAAVGLGTDTCGSIRLPASHTGLYGLRPTSGLSSRAGVIPLSSTLDTVGPIARSVVDLAIVLDATAGQDPADPETVPVEANYVDAADPDGLAGRRIGVVARGFGDVQRAVQAALDLMAENGAELVDVTMPPRGANVFVFLNEFRFALDEYLSARPEAPVRTLAEIVALDVAHAAVSSRLRDAAEVATLDNDTYRQAVDGRQAFRETVVQLMDEYDLDAIAYPASSAPAVLIGGAQEPYDCESAALGGLPAISVPAGLSAPSESIQLASVPLGLELMGRPFGEPDLIAIAAGYEAQTNRHVLPPTTPALEWSR